MHKTIGGIILGIILVVFTWYILEDSFKVFKCKYYNQDWDFVVNEKGVDIECMDR